MVAPIKKSYNKNIHTQRLLSEIAIYNLLIESLYYNIAQEILYIDWDANITTQQLSDVLTIITDHIPPTIVELQAVQDEKDLSKRMKGGYKIVVCFRLYAISENFDVVTSGTLLGSIGHIASSLNLGLIEIAISQLGAVVEPLLDVLYKNEQITVRAHFTNLMIALL